MGVFSAMTSDSWNADDENARMGHKLRAVDLFVYFLHQATAYAAAVTEFRLNLI